MRAICVDDEVLILQLTVRLCESLPGMESVSSFTRAETALKWLESNTADIALLDIDMPGIDGIMLAKQIKDRNPGMAIIFVTGYAQYAVEAFALHASGYLLKPISRERLELEVGYAMANRDKAEQARDPATASEIGDVSGYGEGKPKGYSSDASAGKRARIRTFGNFDAFAGGDIVRFGRAKSKELLAYLVDRQGISVTRAEASGVLWPGSVHDRSLQKQLDVVIRSLRATLQQYGIDDIVELRRGALKVRPALIDCDLYRFLKGDVGAVNEYRGEYMKPYEWADLNEAYKIRDLIVD